MPQASAAAAVAMPEPRHSLWRLAGRFNLCFVPCVVLGVVHIGFALVLPLRAQLLDLTPLGRWLRALTGCWLAFSFSFNWITCVRTNPNGPADALFARLVRESVAAGILEDPGGPVGPPAPWHLLAQGVEGQFLWGYCEKSGRAKPPLSHYCRVTQRLVLNYDHYCPWVANTIGHGNYRYFLLTALNFTLGCAFCGEHTQAISTIIGFTGISERDCLRLQPWR